MKASTLSTAGSQVGLEDLLNSVATTNVGDTDVQMDAKTNEDDTTTVTPEETPPVAESKPAKSGKGKNKPKTDVKKATTVVKKATGKKLKDKKVAAEAPETPATGSEAPATTQDPTPAAETPQEPAATKPAKAKKVFFGRNVIGRLEHRIGSDLGKRLVLTTDDVELPDEEFAAAVDAAKVAFKALPVKQQYLASMIHEVAAGTRDRLTPVLDAALRILASTRSLTTGALQDRMMGGDRKHGKTTASTQAGPAIRTLEALKVIVAGKDKDTYEPNERSTLLALLSERMALSFVDVEASIAEAEAREAEEMAALQDQVPVQDNEPEAPVETPAAAAPGDDVGALIDAVRTASLEGQLAELENALGA